MFVELTDPSNPFKVKFTVGNFYRPPHTNVAQLQSFNRHFANKLESMNTRDTTFVCGDYNINLLSVNSDEHSSSFLNGILSSGFLPAITLPTRASNNSTLIDNVFVNQQAEFNFSVILENEISDHQAVVVNTKLILPHTKTRYITIYSNSEEAKNNFKNDISSKNIFDKLNKNLTNNPNENYNILEEEISNSLEIHMNKQDAREAMRVVFSVLTKRICMHKTKFLMNIFKYCLKIILNSMNLQIATQLIIMFNF